MDYFIICYLSLDMTAVLGLQCRDFTIIVCVWYTGLRTCDMIKGDESDVANIDFEL